MRITFTARHFKTSERLKSFAEEKVKKLSKYYEGILDIEIILDYIKQDQVAEVIVKVDGATFAGVEKSEDMYKSIDLAVNKLERQLLKHKGKQQQFDNERIVESMVEESEIEDED